MAAGQRQPNRARDPRRPRRGKKPAPTDQHRGAGQTEKLGAILFLSLTSSHGILPDIMTNGRNTRCGIDNSGLKVFRVRIDSLTRQLTESALAICQWTCRQQQARAYGKPTARPGSLRKAHKSNVEHVGSRQAPGPGTPRAGPVAYGKRPNLSATDGNEDDGQAPGSGIPTT